MSLNLNDKVHSSPANDEIDETVPITNPSFKSISQAGKDYWHPYSSVPRHYTEVELTTPAQGSHDALYELIKNRRVARIDRGIKDPGSLYSRIRQMRTAIRNKSVTQGEYQCSDRATLQDPAKSEGKKDEWDVGAQVYGLSEEGGEQDCRIHPVVMSQQPFLTNNIPSEEVPSVWHAVCSYISGRDGTFDNMYKRAKNGTIMVMLNNGGLCPETDYVSEASFVDEGTMTEHAVDPIHTAVGLDPKDIRIRRWETNGRPILHLHYKHWPDGKTPKSSECETVFKLADALADETSVISRFSDKIEPASNAEEGIDWSTAPAHWCHCLAGKGRRGVFHALVESKKTLRHLDDHRSRNTAHWQNLVSRHGTDGMLTKITAAMLRDQIAEGTLYATDAGESLKAAPRSELPSINYHTPANAAGILATDVVDQLNEIRPSVEWPVQFNMVLDGVARQISDMETSWATSSPGQAAAR